MAAIVAAPKSGNRSSINPAIEKKFAGAVFCALAIGVTGVLAGSAAIASPEEDLETFRQFYTQRFPDTAINDFINGVYAIDAVARETFDAIEEFAPYEIDIEKGETLYNRPLADGSTYNDCFGKPGVRHLYPRFDNDTGEIVTLESAINDCRRAAGEKPLRYKRGSIAALSAYMAYESRGEFIDIKIPDDPRALEHYYRGKRHFYMKRGQLNLSCADCHMYYAGNRIRGERLSPALGHLTHFPVYRATWGAIGTSHRRFAGCNYQVRARPWKAQSREYKALEYFLTYMSNGLQVNGPSTRR